MKKTIALLGVVLGLSGCGTFPSQQKIQEETTKRAAYDLTCPEKNIVLTELRRENWGGFYSETPKEILYGASGCGSKVNLQVRIDAPDKVKVYKEGTAPNPVEVVYPIVTQPIPSYSPMRATGHY